MGIDDPPSTGNGYHRRVGLILGRLVDAEPVLLAKLFLQVDARSHWASFSFWVSTYVRRSFHHCRDAGAERFGEPWSSGNKLAQSLI